MTYFQRTMMAAGLTLVVSGGAQAQQPGAAPTMPTRTAGDIPGPIDSLDDVQDTMKMAFKLADTNNDGQISQKEAVDVGNLMVGGFFFRADQNGDGQLSPDEAKQARDALFAQQPLLRYVVLKGKTAASSTTAGTTAANAGQALVNIVDTNSDKNLSATELRQAVQTTVQSVYALADTNRDGQMSPTEINAALVGAARTAAQAAFAQADGNKDGQLSREEFDKAIIEPANIVFAIMDGNNDGQISQQETQQARALVGNQLNRMIMPDAPNSARSMLRNGTTLDQGSPIPASPVPASNPR